jgi:ribonuclease VapC
VIIDPSALVAVIAGEPDAAAFERAIRDAPVRRLSAPGYVELAAVIDGRADPVLSGTLDALLRALHVEIVPFSIGQAMRAREAYRTFGRGSGHPARLNMGDCFSYAAAVDLGEPLLFKGADFALTDVEVRTQPVRRHRLSEVIARYEAADPG